MQLPQLMMYAYAFICSFYSNSPNDQFMTSWTLPLSVSCLIVGCLSNRLLVLAETSVRQRNQRRNCSGGDVRYGWSVCLGRLMFLLEEFWDLMVDLVPMLSFAFRSGIHNFKTLEEFQSSCTGLVVQIHIWRLDYVLLWEASPYQLLIISSLFAS